MLEFLLLPASQGFIKQVIITSWPFPWRPSITIVKFSPPPAYFLFNMSHLYNSLCILFGHFSIHISNGPLALHLHRLISEFMLPHFMSVVLCATQKTHQLDEERKNHNIFLRSTLAFTQKNYFRIKEVVNRSHGMIIYRRRHGKNERKKTLNSLHSENDSQPPHTLGTCQFL